MSCRDDSPFYRSTVFSNYCKSPPTMSLWLKEMVSDPSPLSAAPNNVSFLARRTARRSCLTQQMHSAPKQRSSFARSRRPTPACLLRSTPRQNDLVLVRHIESALMCWC